MVYLKDEATGVTVEDMADGLGGVALDKDGWTHPSYATAAQAEAILRGLLRWKLTKLAAACTGPAWNGRWQAIRAWFEEQYQAFEEERSR